MVLTVRPQIKIYRRFQKDIWGFLYIERFKYKYVFRPITRILRSAKVKIKESPYWIQFFKDIMSNIFNFFYKLFAERKRYRRNLRRRYIYRLDIFERRERRRRMSERFASVRITRLYFLTFQDYQFRKLFRRATKKDGDLEINFCYFLEGRLLYVLYRSNYLTNPFHIMKFIKQQNVCVGFKVIDRPNYLVPIAEFVTFNWNVWPSLLCQFIRRLRIKNLAFNTPRYMHINFNLNYFYLIKYPRRRDLIYPIKLDIQRLTGYF